MTRHAVPLLTTAARRAVLLAVLGLALGCAPAQADSTPAPRQVHVPCIPWRGVVLAVGGGALAGWVLMRLGRSKPLPPPQ
jgi:hypothetical protein